MEVSSRLTTSWRGFFRGAVAPLRMTNLKGDGDVSGVSRRAVDKCTWTVAGSCVPSRSALPAQLHDELPAILSTLVPSAVEAHVTVQQRDQYSGANIATSTTSGCVDAVIEVETEEESPPLDDLHAYLRRTWLHVQGWRVKPTLIYDSTIPRTIGESSRSPAQIVFIERLDGTTRAHFDRNWFIHAGHFDGLEAQSEASLAERRREEEQSSDLLYRQNRVIETITPTAWRIDGYAQLQLGFFVPEVGADPYPRVRGEAPFDRWPPRILQGYEYRIL